MIVWMQIEVQTKVSPCTDCPKLKNSRLQIGWASFDKFKSALA